MVYGLDECPYEGGYYVGKLLLPVEYPSKPPGIIMITPTGWFECEKKICLSMSDYHPETWSPAWSISKVLIGLVSFLVTDERTTGCIITSELTKWELAKKSLLYNLDHIPYFEEMFGSVFEELDINPEKIKWTRDEVKQLKPGSAGLSSNTDPEANNKPTILMFFGILIALIYFKFS